MSNLHPYENNYRAAPDGSQNPNSRPSLRVDRHSESNFYGADHGSIVDSYYHNSHQSPLQEYAGQEPAWDGKSSKSYNTYHTHGSEQHLVPAFEMSQVNLNANPMPTLAYQQPDYPPMPAQSPYVGRGMPQARMNAGRADSSGWTATREHLMKRRSVRQVALQEGNLVLDIPAPTSIVPQGSAREELTHIRYTAATCDPDDFVRSKYSLRPFLYGRKTELFIVMTMYNEDEVLFCKTMNAVIKNIGHLASRSSSKTWGAQTWEKIVVCVVSDGRQKINQRTLKVLGLMGCYAEGLAKDTVNGKDVQAHIFEYTTSVMVTPNGEVTQTPCPIQVIFCLKEQNKKKLNSHRWFFNAFAPLINPNVCILLDVGTKPTGTSLYELWKCFDKHPNCGGACGEIAVDTGRGCGLIFKSPLAASQNFEYKMSNILDKPLESVFGYISVLPGAFSAYRYKALKNLPSGNGPLASYFKGETLHAGGAGGASLNTRNMYLAEDRILCFEIVTKPHEAWTLKYVKSAKAVTDVPTTVPEFISQRRRWLNGSFFAGFHATLHFYKIWTSGHGFFRKLALQFEFIYNAIQLLFSWISLANFYLAFFFLVQSATQPGKNDAFNFLANNAGAKVFEVILKVYIAVLLVSLICSLGNRPQGSKWSYIMCIIVFGLCNIVTLWCAGFTVYLAVPHTEEGWSQFGKLFEDQTFRDIFISFMATYGLYILGSLIHFEFWHLFTCTAQYMFFLPSYVNILMMYSMCNLHDLAWGTKGDNGTSKDLGSAKKVKDAKGNEVLEVEVMTQREDVEQLWIASRNALRVPHVEEKQHRDAATKQSDHDRNSRTNVVLAWLGTNIVMIIVFTSDFWLQWAQNTFGRKNTLFNPYLIFLFYSVAGLSAVRFVGCVAYMVFRLVGH